MTKRLDLNGNMQSSVDAGYTHITDRILLVSLSPDSTAYEARLEQALTAVCNKHGEERVLVVSSADSALSLQRLCKNVLELIWPSHLAFPLDRLCHICKTADEWLSSHANNVLAFHCKGPRGPLALLLASIRTYNSICAIDDQTLGRFALKTYYDENLAGATNPSQKRYIQYFSGLLLGDIRINSTPLRLTSITLHGTPRPNDRDVQIFFKIYRGLTCVHTTEIQRVTSSDGAVTTPVTSRSDLCGDVLVVAYLRRLVSSRQVLFRCQFPTHVVNVNEIEFSKAELDEVCSDPLCPNDFRVAFSFTADDSDEAIYENFDRKSQPEVVRSDSYEAFAAQLAEEVRGGEEEEERIPSSASNSVFDMARTSKSDAAVLSPLTEPRRDNLNHNHDVNVSVMYSIDSSNSHNTRVSTQPNSLPSQRHQPPALDHEAPHHIIPSLIENVAVAERKTRLLPQDDASPTSANYENWFDSPASRNDAIHFNYQKVPSPASTENSRLGSSSSVQLRPSAESRKTTAPVTSTKYASPPVTANSQPDSARQSAQLPRSRSSAGSQRPPVATSSLHRETTMSTRAPFGSSNAGNAYSSTYERSYVRETYRGGEQQPGSSYRQTSSSTYGPTPATVTSSSYSSSFVEPTSVSRTQTQTHTLPPHVSPPEKPDFTSVNAGATTDLDRIIDDLLHVSGANANYYTQRAGGDFTGAPAQAGGSTRYSTTSKYESRSSASNHPSTSSTNFEIVTRDRRYGPANEPRSRSTIRPPPSRETLDASNAGRYRMTLNTEIGADRRVRSSSVEPEGRLSESDMEARNDRIAGFSTRSQRGTSVPQDRDERNWQVRVDSTGGASMAGYETNGRVNGSGSNAHQSRYQNDYDRSTSSFGSQHKFMMHQLSEQEQRLIEELRNSGGSSTSMQQKSNGGYARSATTEFRKSANCADCSYGRDVSPLRAVHLTVDPQTGTISSNDETTTRVHRRHQHTTSTSITDAETIADGEQVVIRDIPLKSDPPITVSLSTLRRNERVPSDATAEEFTSRRTTERTFTSHLEHNHNHNHDSQQPARRHHYSEHEERTYSHPVRVTVASAAGPEDGRSRTTSSVSTVQSRSMQRQSSSPHNRSVYTERTIPIQAANDAAVTMRRGVNEPARNTVQVTVQKDTITTSRRQSPTRTTVVETTTSSDEQVKKMETSKTVEVFEEVETIALQPIGKGVQDLSSSNHTQQNVSGLNTISRSMANVNQTASAAPPQSFIEQDIETVALQPIGKGVKDLETPNGSRSHSQANLAGLLGPQNGGGIQQQRSISTVRTVQTSKYQNMDAPRFVKSVSDLRMQSPQVIPSGNTLQPPGPHANFTMLRQPSANAYTMNSYQREQYTNELHPPEAMQQLPAMAPGFEQRRATSVSAQPEVEEVIVASSVKKQQSVGPRLTNDMPSPRPGVQLRVDTSSYSPQNGTMQAGRTSTLSRLQPPPSPGLVATDEGMRMVNDVMRFWYKPKMPREEVISILRGKQAGAFLVRDSNSYPGSYGLAVKVAQLPPNVPQKSNDISTDLVRHFLIEPTSKGIRLKGCSNEPTFSSLTALIYQHTVTPLALPVKLALPDSDCAPWYNDDGYAKYETQRAFSTSGQATDKMDNEQIVNETVNMVHSVRVQSVPNRSPQSAGLLSAAPNFDTLLQQTSGNMSAPSSDSVSLNSAGKDQPSIMYSVLYLGDVEVESLTGPKAIARAVDQLEKQQITITDASCKVSPVGVTITDNQRKLFFRKHIPIASVLHCGFEPQDRRWNTQSPQPGGGISAKIFGLVARKLSGPLSGLGENVCYVFAEVSATQPAANLIKFTMQLQAQSHASG